VPEPVSSPSTAPKKEAILDADRNATAIASGRGM
jgi:hypothetical protein